MDQLLQQQHQQEGTDNLSLDQLKDALGGILSYVKAHLDKFDFNKITAALPEADELVAKAETENATGSRAAEGGSGGFMASAMGMLEKATSKGDATATASGDSAAATGTAPIDSMTQLLGYLTKAGIDPKQIMTFLPVVAGFLKQHAGVDVSSALGTPAAAAPASAPSGGQGTAEAATAPASTGDKPDDVVGDLMNQASGFMSSFGKK
jgi:hypothetical protein